MLLCLGWCLGCWFVDCLSLNFNSVACIVLSFVL